MLTKKAITIVVTILLLSSIGPASYAKAWEFLGEAHVDGKIDHDRIKVGRSEGRYRALQLKVDRGDVEFHHVVVHYANGTSEEVQVRQKVRGGGKSRAIDLNGQDRTIQSVEFWYEPAKYGSRHPRVRLYGR